MRLFLMVALAMVVAPISRAIPIYGGPIIGSGITGEFYYGNDPTDYFDPNNIFVNPVYLNSVSNSVTAADPGIEFGLTFLGQNATADFTAHFLTIHFDFAGPGGQPWKMVFTGNAMKGPVILKTTDTFEIPITFTVVGNVLTVQSSGALLNPAGIVVFQIGTPTPEPASWMLFAPALLILLIVEAVRRRRQNR